MDNRLADVHAYHANPAEHRTMDGSALARAGQASQNTPFLDNQLIVQIGQRNEQALGTLYDRYSARIYTTALRITYDQALAETIVVQVFQSVWQSASSFPIGASVPGWLIGMTRQRAIDATQLRGSHTYTRLATPSEGHAICSDQQRAGGADAMNMRSVLETLPTNQRETVELAYYSGLTCREIATQLHASVSTIKRRLRVGMFKLREGLGSDAADASKQNL